MKKLLIGMLLLGGSAVFSMPVYAETYQYIDTNGRLQVVVAENPTEAIRNAPNIAVHSGVMTMVTDSSFNTNTGDTQSYGYIDTQGVLRIQIAHSPSEAIALAPNRDPRSGVMFVSN